MPVMLPGAYRSPYAGMIAQLMQRQGDIAAEGAARSGQIWGGAVSQLGQIGAQAYEQHREEKARQKREGMVNQVMQSWDGQDPRALWSGLAPIIGPESAMKVAGGMAGLMSAHQKAEPDVKDLAATVGGLAALEKSSPGYIERNWQTLHPALDPVARKFGMPVGPDWSEDVTKGVLALDGQFNAPKPTDAKVVDGALVDPSTGRVIYKGDPKPEKSLAEIEAEAAARARGTRAGNPQGDAGPDAAVALTPAALDIAAKRYLTDGTLPPMGMGRASGAARQRIINRAAELDPNANIAGNAATFAADKGSLGAMQKMVDSVSAFESTASKNAALLDKVLDKIPNFGSSYANRPARELSRVMGSEDMTQFNTLRQSVANEYARIISNPGLSGVMSDSAREEGAVLLDPNATAGQIRAAIKALAAEAKNRHTEYQGQLESIKGRLRGGTSDGWKDLGNGVRIREKR